MKRCLACEGLFNAESWQCPECGHSPPLVHGFESFASPVGEDGFRPEDFAELAALEDRHFWFRARNRLIVDCLKGNFPECKSFLEIGCGTGYVLAGIEKACPAMALSGSEYFAEGLPFAAARVQSARLCQADARNLPFANEFDVVGAFDVLEHIEDDSKVLAEISRVLRPRGGVMLTVPQHRWLWSHTDVSAHHVRRYTQPELQSKLLSAGFRVVFSCSFVALLLPLLLLARRRRAPADHLSELRIGQFLNGACGTIMALERVLIGAGMRFPCGGSLLVVAKKLEGRTA